jgi:hypothetical protein
MFLIILLGYLVAYAVLFMMFVAFCCAVAISFAVYVTAYLGSYAWHKIRHRASPEWQYKRVAFKIDEKKIQENAMIAGVFAMTFMVFGFFVYAFTSSWNTTVGWTFGLAVLSSLVWWDNQRKPSS